MKKKMREEILYPNCENGIYMYEYVDIGGVKQYIQIRGKDRKNPLLLFVHGGPGASMAGLAHVMFGAWEDSFTVVHWDQRNTCKTYLANKDRAKEIAKTGTVEDYIKDIDEIIGYLHTVYEFDKIILMGFSWGTVIASEYAKVHPENVSIYIGVGQLINYVEGFEVVCNQLLERAILLNNKKDIAKINKILESLPEDGYATDELLKQVQVYIKLGSKYITKNTRAFPTKEFFQSPLLDKASRKTWFKHDTKMFEGTFKTMCEYDFRDNMNFSVPVVFITGEEDTSCPHSMLQEIIDSVEAPKKELHILSKAGHTCFWDNPEDFLSILKGCACEKI